MTTNKPQFVMGLAQSEPVLSSTSRSSRKNDATAFADIMETNEGTKETSVATQPVMSEHMKTQAYTALNKMMNPDPLLSGVYKPQALSAMQNALESTAMRGVNHSVGNKESESLRQTGISLDKTTKGIALPDKRLGIAIDIQHEKIAAIHNVALNRNRPNQTDHETLAARSTQRKTLRSRATDLLKNAFEGLGSLAARYESGSEGIAAIGYDRVGGTSYGKYQIASRPGSMNGFLTFLENEAPDLAERLKTAGPANTGSRSGKMPEVWREIAATEPERFEQLQEQFIHESHYEPALNAVRGIGYDTNAFSPAMKEVLWSTAVQHGPAGAASIFARAAEAVGLERGGSQRQQETKLISEIYALRAGRFGSSTPQIQAAARKRMESEKNIALSMVENYPTA